MSVAKLKANQARLEQYERALEDAKRAEVAVGLPKEKIGATLYKGGASVLKIGAIHEYGAPTVGIPRRSWLHNSVEHEADKIYQDIRARFRDVFEHGSSVKNELGLVGAGVREIVVASFRNNGYGTWPALKAETVRAKGSSAPLFDHGTLRSSITWVVR